MYNNRNSSDDAAEYKRVDIRRNYIANVKFTNTLPDLPYPPKFILMKRDMSKFVDYTNNQFIKRQKRPVLAEYDAGVNVELIDPKVYNGGKYEEPCKIEPHWKDVLLLEDEYHQFREKTRSETHATPVSFMKSKMWPPRQSRTPASVARPVVSRIETKIGYNLEKQGEMQLYQTREMQIEAIQKTFEDVKIPCKEHYAKKGVYAVEELPVLPDFEYLGYALVNAEFATYPDPSGMPEGLKHDALKLSQIINTGDSCGHFIPTVETIGKLIDVAKKDGEEEDFKTEYKYTLDREYNHVLRGSPEEFYFRVIPGEAVAYGPLEENKIVLSRVRNPAERKKKSGVLRMRHRAPTANEVAEMTNRMQGLLTKKEKEVEEEKPNEVAKVEPAKKTKDEYIAGQQYEEIEEPDSSSESSDLSSVSSSSDEYAPTSSKSRKLLSDDEDLPRQRKIKIKSEPESSSSSSS